MSLPKKPRTCRVCKTLFQPVRCLQNACSPACAQKAAEISRAKKDRQREKDERRMIKDGLEKLKTRSQWMREAQMAFNAYRREVAKVNGYPCISSGRPLDWSGNNVDAGHYRSIGSAPHLRFNEDNCHAQSKHDNRYLSGNAVDYRLGLISRIGLARVEALEADQTPRKYSIEELKAIKAHYIAKLKELRK